MVTHLVLSKTFTKLRFISASLATPLNRKGQAVVEFTLIFILLLVVAWIPADFGLAFYTGQLALNASREGARIAAADRNLTAGTTSCIMPCASATGLLKATADRMSSALLPGATVQLLFPASGAVATCDQTVQVSISGSYNFFFYKLLRLLGLGNNIGAPVNISRQTSMRWEHQC